MVPHADYSLTPEEVYKSAFASLAAGGDLDFLTLVNEERHVNLPSWCPHLLSERFRMRRLYTLLNHPADRLPQFVADDSTTASCKVSDNRENLTVAGALIGTVVPYLELDDSGKLVTRYFTDEDVWEALCRSTVGNICRLSDADHTYTAPSSFGDVFALDCVDAQERLETQEIESTYVTVAAPLDIPTTTVTHAHKNVYGRPVQSFEEWYRTLTDPSSQTHFPADVLESWALQHLSRRSISTDQTIPEIASAYDEFRHTSFPRTMAGRRLLFTDTGYIGLGLDTAKSGDVVAVLYGCKMPMILRPEEDHFVVVGECYVHGAMYGEALRNVDAKEREFELR